MACNRGVVFSRTKCEEKYMSDVVISYPPRRPFIVGFKPKNVLVDCLRRRLGGLCAKIAGVENVETEPVVAVGPT